MVGHDVHRYPSRFTFRTAFSAAFFTATGCPSKTLTEPMTKTEQKRSNPFNILQVSVLFRDRSPEVAKGLPIFMGNSVN